MPSMYKNVCTKAMTTVASDFLILLGSSSEQENGNQPFLF